MAAINVLTPKYGKITVLSTDASNYIVRYDPPGEGVDFNGWKVFCHACGRYLYRSNGNPASFDIKYLLDTGHPGPFDISADTSAEVEYCVTTRADDPSMGTTSPDEKWFTSEVGDTIKFTIKATPNDGYEFVKWVSSTGKEFTNATTTISKELAYGTDFCEYVAYFRKKKYYVYVLRKRGNPTNGSTDWWHLPEDSTISSTAGPRKVYYKKSGDDVLVAYIYSNKIAAEAYSDVTLSVQMLPEAKTYGVRFLGWRQQGDGRSGDETSFVAHVKTENVKVNAIFTIEAVKVKFTVKSPLYGYIVPPELPTIGWEPALLPNGEKEPAESRSRCSSWTVAVLKNTRFSFGLELYSKASFEGITYAAKHSFLHGSSSSKFSYDSQHDLGYFTSGDEDEDVEIYLCTHLLVHKPDGQNLESKPPELLFDCNVPTSQ